MIPTHPTFYFCHSEVSAATEESAFGCGQAKKQIPRFARNDNVVIIREFLGQRLK